MCWTVAGLLLYRSLEHELGFVFILVGNSLLLPIKIRTELKGVLAKMQVESINLHFPAFRTAIIKKICFQKALLILILKLPFILFLDKIKQKLWKK